MTYSSLQRRCPRQVGTLSVRRVSTIPKCSSSQLKPLLMPWSSGVWRSTRLVAHTATNSMSGNVARRHWKQCRKTPAEAQSCSCLLQIAYHKNCKCLFIVWKSKSFVPNSAQLSFQTIRVILMSPLNHNVGVATCLMRPAPLRIAMTLPAVASNLISRLGLSISSP